LQTKLQTSHKKRAIAGNALRSSFTFELRNVSGETWREKQERVESFSFCSRWCS